MTGDLSSYSMKSELDLDVTTDRDAWTIVNVNSFNSATSIRIRSDELIAALATNRERMNEMREKYAKLVEEDGGIVVDQPSRARRACFKELNRIYSAVDSIKTTLRLRGVDFPFDEWDEEHPNAAYRRLRKQWDSERKSQEAEQESSCYVVSFTFGPQSYELSRAEAVCFHRFVLNPWVLPSFVLYRTLGPIIVAGAARSGFISTLAKNVIAKPIVNASGPNFWQAAPWILLLGIPGWLVIMATALAVGK